MTETSLANSTLLHNLTPIFTCLGEWIFLKQIFDRKFLLGMLFAVVGAITLGICDFGVSPNYFWGDSLALASALLYSIYLLIIGRLRVELDSAKILFWCCLIGTILCIPVILISGNDFFPATSKTWLELITLGILCQALGHGLLAYSLKKFSSGFISVGLLFESIFSFAFGWIFFQEMLNRLDLIMFFVILLGLLLVKTSNSSLRNSSISESNQDIGHDCI